MSFLVGAIIAKAIFDTTDWITGQKKIDKSSSKMDKTLSKIGKVVKGMAIAVGAALTKCVISASEFEKELANVSTLVDTSVIDIKEMGKELLALDPRLGSATELTKGLYQAISASVAPADAVRFVGEAAKFAKAALTDTNTAVNVITTGLNAYGYAADQATRISDVLFETIRLGKTTGEELASSIGASIPLFANMKIPIEELGAAMVITTRQGINVAESTTMLNAVVSGFLKPSSKMTEQLKKLGYSSGSAALQSLGFKDALNLVKKSTNGNNEELAKLFPNVRALKGVLALTGEGAKDYTKILESMEDASGATNVAFEKQKMTFSTLMNSVDRLAIQVGEALLPAVSKIVVSITEFVQKIAENEEMMNLLSFAADLLGTGLQILGEIVIFILTPLSKAVEFFGDMVVRSKELNMSTVENTSEILALSRRLDELNQTEVKSAETRAEIEKVTARLVKLLPDSASKFLSEAEGIKASVEQLARRELILKNEEIKKNLLDKIRVIEKDIGKAEKELVKRQDEYNKAMKEGGTLVQNFSEAELKVLRATGATNEEIQKGPIEVRKYEGAIDNAQDTISELKQELKNTKKSLEDTNNALINLSSTSFSSIDTVKKETGARKDEAAALNAEEEALRKLQAQKQMDETIRTRTLSMRRQGEMSYTQWQMEQDAIRDELKKKQDEEELQRQQEKIERYKEVADVISSYAQPIFESFGAAIATQSLSWESLWGVIKETLASILTALGKEAVVQAAISFAAFNFVSGGLWTAAAALAFTAAGFVKALAEGGSVSANQPVIVGEEGQELFIPEKAGRVYSNNDSKNIINRAQQQDNVPINNVIKLNEAILFSVITKGSRDRKIKFYSGSFVNE